MSSWQSVHCAFLYFVSLTKLELHTQESPPYRVLRSAWHKGNWPRIGRQSEAKATMLRSLVEAPAAAAEFAQWSAPHLIGVGLPLGPNLTPAGAEGFSFHFSEFWARYVGHSV